MPDLTEWFEDQQNEYWQQTGHDFNEAQAKRLCEIWTKYQVNGVINWEDHTLGDSAWYWYMKDVIGIEDEGPSYEDLNPDVYIPHDA